MQYLKTFFYVSLFVVSCGYSLLCATSEDPSSSLLVNAEKTTYDKIAQIAEEYSKNIVIDQGCVHVCNYYGNSFAEHMHDERLRDKFIFCLPLGLLSVYMMNQVIMAASSNNVARSNSFWTELIHLESSLFTCTSAGMALFCCLLDIMVKMDNHYEKEVWATFNDTALEFISCNQVIPWQAIHSIGVEEKVIATRGEGQVKKMQALCINKKDGSSFLLYQKDIPIGIHLFADIIEVYLKRGIA